MKSPCIGCEFEHEDKNADRCQDCQKRLEYARSQGMISPEPNSRESQIQKPKTGRPFKIGRKPRTQINFHFSEEFNQESYALMKDVEMIAKQEMRRRAEQVLYFIKQGVERWKQEHK